MLRSVTSLDTAQIAQQARELADKATRLAAESIPLALEAVGELSTLAADLEASNRIHHYLRAHRDVEAAFFAALCGPDSGAQR